MPSLLEKIRRKRAESHDGHEKEQASRQVEAPSAPPEFKLFRQSTQDPEPWQVDDLEQNMEKMQVNYTYASEPNAQQTSSKGEPGAMPKTPEKSEATPAGPTPRSAEKRLSSRFLKTLSRRPSQMSSRSRSSSYVPEFKPIDREGDVEAQWEQRATMLARAGPPSPAIPRTDSLFDQGPPRLPPVEGQSTHAESPMIFPGDARSVSAPEPYYTSPTRQKMPVRETSSTSRRTLNMSTATSISENGNFTHEGQTKDDLLQSAIREHERGNLEIAAQLFKKSAQGEDGLPMGKLMYGLSLRHGWGVQRDEARAINWLRAAAESSAAVEELALSSGLKGGGQMKGDLVLAIFELGNCFRHGWGIEVDKDLARNYYETAANLGDSDAMYEVAWCYETGFGIKKDKYKAAFWYRKSEVHGSKIPGMQWIWKPKYDHDPFLESDAQQKVKEKKSKDKRA